MIQYMQAVFPYSVKGLGPVWEADLFRQMQYAELQLYFYILDQMLPSKAILSNCSQYNFS